MKKKWYQNEWYWMIIALCYLAVTFVLVSNFLPTDYIVITFPALLYLTYFIGKGLMYAFILNPIRSWRIGDTMPAKLSTSILIIFSLLIWSIYYFSQRF